MLEQIEQRFDNAMENASNNSEWEKVFAEFTPPRWLVGYRSSTTDEWMGSLVAEVDGRNVPLSVGYHKVNVDIRDQIAATTVEQSFVNLGRYYLCCRFVCGCGPLRSW